MVPSLQRVLRSKKIKKGENKMKKILFSALIVPLALGLLAGCGSSTKADSTSSTKESSTPKQELTKISIGYMPNFSSVGLAVIAQEAGYFEEEGLEVELVEFADGPTIIAAMESGSISVGNIGPGAHKLLPQGKAQVVTMDQLGNADAVLGLKSKGVEKIADLKGKTIAVASGTSSETILKLTLQEAGLTDKDVTLMDMDASAITTAMLSGKIDAAATWSPNTHTIAKELGDDVVTLSNNERYVDTVPTVSSWAVKPGYYEANKEVLTHFTSALMKAMNYRKEDGSEMAAWVAKQLAVDVASVELQLKDGQYFTAKEIGEKLANGELYELYGTQQQNFINTGMLEDSKDLLTPKDYVLSDLLAEATK